MSKFKKGDIVICTRFSIEQTLLITSERIEWQNTICDHYFNREAVISYSMKDFDIARGFKDSEDKEEYMIEFLDDHSSLAWISGDELIPKTSFIISERNPTFLTEDVSYIDYIYEKIKTNCGNVQFIDEEHIINQVGILGFNLLVGNKKLENRGVINGKRLYTLILK